MKILHLPTSTAGFAWGLSSIENKQGHTSDVLITDKNPYKYPYKFSVKKGFVLFHWVKKVILFLRIRKKYDLYHFNYGTSLLDLYFFGLPLLDLPYYRGKKCITFNGSDARGWSFPVYKDETAKALDKAYRKLRFMSLRRRLIKLKIKRLKRTNTTVFLVNPDLFHYIPKATFLPYSISSWDKISPIPYKLNDKIRIVHSPTSRELKGSKYITAAIGQLQKKYPQIEFTLVEGLTHSEAMKAYANADLVIDQVLIGWYGGFGVEVMKMGKPLAVFIREEDLKFIPKGMEKDLKNTIININPENIVAVLEPYIKNPEQLMLKSKQSLYYVNKWHDPTFVQTIVQSKVISDETSNHSRSTPPIC